MREGGSLVGPHDGWMYCRGPHNQSPSNTHHSGSIENKIAILIVIILIIVMMMMMIITIVITITIIVIINNNSNDGSLQ